MDGRRREEEKEEEKKKRREEERKIKGMKTNLEYGIVWNYECLNGILKFYVKVHAIVWLGACPKPRVVRISS